jgi:hypothetical protein
MKTANSSNAKDRASVDNMGKKKKIFSDDDEMMMFEEIFLPIFENKHLTPIGHIT